MRFLLYTHLFIGLCSAALLLETLLCNQFSLKDNIGYLCMVFFSTVLVYNVKGMLILIMGITTVQPERQSWILRNRKLLINIIAISVIGIFVSLFFVKKTIVYYLLPAGILSLGYSFPLLIGKNKVAVKEIPYIKTFLVAFIWTIVVVYLPFIETWNQISRVRVLSEFLFLFSLSILFDIKDMESDKNNNVKTLAILLGVMPVKIVSVFLLLTRMGIIFFFANTIGAIFSELLVTATCLIVILRFLKKESPEYFYMAWVDGLLIFKGFIVVFLCKLLANI